MKKDFRIRMDKTHHDKVELQAGISSQLFNKGWQLISFSSKHDGEEKEKTRDLRHSELTQK